MLNYFFSFNKWRTSVFVFIFSGLFSASFALVQTQNVELKYQNFRMVYHPDDESRVLNLMQVLKKSIPQFEKNYGIQLKSVVFVYFPSTKVEFNRLTGTKLPGWSSALFFPEKGSIIFKRPEWVSGDYNISQTFVHELSHVYFSAKFSPGLPPLWFNEGLAEYYSKTRISLNGGVQLANALFTKRLIALTDIDSLLSFPRVRAELGYLESLSAVIYLKNKLIPDSTQWRNFLDDIAARDFEFALQKHTGLDLIDFRIKWFRWLQKKYEWFVVFNLENLIWVAMALVLFGAMYAIRYRNKKRMAQMELEESWFDSMDKENHFPDESKNLHGM